MRVHFLRPRSLLLAGSVALGLAGMAHARQGIPPASSQNLLALRPLDQVPVVALAPIDRERLLAEDALHALAGPAPLRFASPIEVLATPDTDGAWETLADGSRLWRLRVSVPGATDLNFGFSRFAVPDGATLHVVPENGAAYEGPYGARDAFDGQLWTPVVAGDRATLELRLPPGAKGAPSLALSRVGAGYRDMLRGLDPGPVPMSGSCNNDVACPEGDPWRNEINSVALLQIDGSLACSGTMIMDVPRDFRLFLLTANHCLIDTFNDATVVAYWNYQASSCNGPRDGQLLQSLTGSDLRATSPLSDFTLLEMFNAPNPAFNVYWAGWDRSDTIPPGSVGIHHPSLDEKAITFNTDPLEYGDNCYTLDPGTHWTIAQYEDGTTEGGSSGSGLWDPSTHLLVGTLTGGFAACGVPDFDCYGRFAKQWTGEGTPETRLSDWLDPGGTGALSAPGSYVTANARLVSAAFTDSCALGGGDGNGVAEPGETLELRVSLVASGDLSGLAGTLTSLSPGVTVDDAQATWPDLFTGIPRESVAPHFTVTLGRSVACYQPISFRLDVTANEGGPFQIPLSVDVGAPPATDAPVAIVDETTVTSRVTIAQDVTISGLRVAVNLTHSWMGDLRIQLRSPAGTVVTLLDQPGDPPTPGGCGDLDMDVVFDDASVVDPESHCTGTRPWLSGPARPAAPLSAFDGESTTGTWQLLVTDLAPADTGTILGWSLLTTPPLEGTCIPCASACPGQEISASDVRVRKATLGAISISYTGALSACATGEQIRVAFSARPAAMPGAFPTDPDFADVTSQDRDPLPLVFRHVPPAFPGAPPATFTWYYQIVEELPGGVAGPSGSYGY